MAVDEDDTDVPESGAVFTFGKCRFNDNIPGKFWLRDDKVSFVSCGDDHTVIVAESGKLFTFGDNSWGQLGLGHNKTVNKPTRVKALTHEKVKMAACGRSHTLVATDSGIMYSFGQSHEGQLGFDCGSEDRVTTPKQFSLADSDATVKMLYAGGNHSACLTEAGEVFIWGCGSEGQLGLGEDIDKQVVPTKLKFEDRIVQVACGYYHTMLVTAAGLLYACGEPDCGKLGWSPMSSDVDHYTPQLVSGFSDKIVSVSCGNNHTVAITEHGDVYAFGDGSNGQLGGGTKCMESYSPLLFSWSKPTKIVQVSCGEGHTALISDLGILFTFGDGRNGKLALGDDNLSNHFSPTIVTRFKGFRVEQVFCGGCHTVVTARPRADDDMVDHFFSDYSVHDPLNEPVPSYLSAVAELIRQGELSNSIDISGSISARIRRRQKAPESTLTQPLLPLLSVQETPSTASHADFGVSKKDGVDNVDAVVHTEQQPSATAITAAGSVQELQLNSKDDPEGKGSGDQGDPTVPGAQSSNNKKSSETESKLTSKVNNDEIQASENEDTSKEAKKKKRKFLGIRRRNDEGKKKTDENNHTNSNAENKENDDHENDGGSEKKSHPCEVSNNSETDKSLVLSKKKLRKSFLRRKKEQPVVVEDEHVNDLPEDNRDITPLNEKTSVCVSTTEANDMDRESEKNVQFLRTSASDSDEHEDDIKDQIEETAEKNDRSEDKSQEIATESKQDSPQEEKKKSRLCAIL